MQSDDHGSWKDYSNRTTLGYDVVRVNLKTPWRTFDRTPRYSVCPRCTFGMGIDVMRSTFSTVGKDVLTLEFKRGDTDDAAAGLQQKIFLQDQQKHHLHNTRSDCFCIFSLKTDRQPF